MSTALSPRAFGEALGVSRQAVQQAITSGRLKDSLGKDERTGWTRIDLEKGRREWRAWTDPDKSRNGKPAGRPTAASKGTPSLFAEEREHKREQITHARASAERVALDAELKRLELDTLRGNLVDRREVQKEAFKLARILRERLQAIPDRVAAKVAALEKPALVHELLAGEIALALQSLENSEEEEVPSS